MHAKCCSRYQKLEQINLCIPSTNPLSKIPESNEHKTNHKIHSNNHVTCGKSKKNSLLKSTAFGEHNRWFRSWRISCSVDHTNISWGEHFSPPFRWCSCVKTPLSHNPTLRLTYIRVSYQFIVGSGVTQHSSALTAHSRSRLVRDHLLLLLLSNFIK